MKYLLRLSYILLLFLAFTTKGWAEATTRPVMGAERMELLLPLLEGKRVALMVNQSSLVGETKTHLVDTLLSRGVQISKIFVPEHGLRGKVDAGKHVSSGTDPRTGLPVISLYGQTKRPTPEMLSDVDVLIFDLQDVGVRFYTYISSMHYLMEAAQEAGKTFVVCDRPNPCDFVDGPIRESDCRSFIGVDPLPVAHGMTVGELALMINGQRWLRSGKACQLKVIPLLGWQHGDAYSLPVRPSPNLPNDRSIALYPSLCFFEATILSVGRGTDKPFQAIGHPNKQLGGYVFTPQVKSGEDSNPKHRGKACYGMDFSETSLPSGRLSLAPLIELHQRAMRLGLKLIDRPRTFDLLAGTKRLREQILGGQSEEAIRASWQEGIKAFLRIRRLYLLYPEGRRAYWGGSTPPTYTIDPLAPCEREERSMLTLPPL